MKSTKIVPLQQPESAVVYTATVISVSNKHCVIELSGTHYTAQIIFSCLVQPIKNDVVMCVLSATGDYYITGVVEREASQSMTVSFPEDVTMQSLTGSMSFLSSDSVTVAASKNINCISDQALHKSNRAVVNYDQLTASGTDLQSSFSSVRLISDFINTMSKQVLQKFKNYVRHTEESDQTKAGNMTRQVKGLYSMDSQHTILISKKDTKIDGERIHMG
ncbi:MAG: DUF3540 domain-containing protein [Gammaproteobacteria bacterium]|nr:DUF3540 domain-containing protein [Gammaproteobacteria bacterium]